MSMGMQNKKSIEQNHQSALGTPAIFRAHSVLQHIPKHLQRWQAISSCASPEDIRGKSAPPALEGRPSFVYFSWARKKSKSPKAQIHKWISLISPRRIMPWYFFFISLFLISTALPTRADKLLIPMDLSQADHLKAYGIAYWTLQKGMEIEWLLNYKGGSFFMDYDEAIALEARVRAVSFQRISGGDAARIYAEIDAENMNRMHLEKAPKIAVYTPPSKQPWDDAVTLALTYAEIPYDTLWDEEVLSGKLEDYDWLHLHHEDFTGQYGKFYRSNGTQLWYRQQQATFETLSHKLGYAKVSQFKGAVALSIFNYIQDGGFLFAMCSATDTFDIALSAQSIDIVDSVYDGDGMDPQAQQKLDFSRTMAFENFTLVTDPMEYEHSDIDISPTELNQIHNADTDAFTLFEFSAKYDPVPTMLTQNHTPIISGFLGQTTAFNKNKIKKNIIILGNLPGSDQVKYIHGGVGRGTFTFYAGHDPEDYQHFVNDPPTQLALHKNSPGYRLILNNILFPAAKKEKQKT